MERAAGFTHEDAAQAKLDKLDALLTQSSTPPRGCGIVSRSVVTTEGRTLSSHCNCSRNSADKRTLEALIKQIEALAQQNPVLMIFEDVHWIDPTSLEVLW